VLIHAVLELVRIAAPSLNSSGPWMVLASFAVGFLRNIFAGREDDKVSG
jgi:hypothetical protein